MKLQDLTRDQLELLNTDFGEELEKQAEAIVDEEAEKLAEVQDQAQALYDYGAELAMQKIAEMEQKYKEGEDKEEDEEEDEEEGEDKEEEKTASAMGKFILEGYWETMMEKGAEFYGDERIYLEELVKEGGLGEAAKATAEFFKKYYGKGIDAAKKGGSAVKSHFKGVYEGAREGGKGVKAEGKKAWENYQKARKATTLPSAAKYTDKYKKNLDKVKGNLKKMAPAAAYGAGGAAAIGGGTYYGLKRRKEK